MSIGFLDLFLLQKVHADTSTATQAADEAQRASSAVRRAVDGLELQIDRLTLLVVALSELVTEHGVCTEAQLKDRIQAVDLRDGKADGRLAPAAVTCPTCRRVKSAVRARCVWCGTETALPLAHRPPVG